MAVRFGVPRVAPAVVARENLSVHLDARPALCVIRSAGGTGKTTLVAQWVHAHTDLDVIWMTLTDQVHSRTGFWIRFVTHLHRAGVIDDTTLYRQVADLADRPEAAPQVIGEILPTGVPLLVVVDNFATPARFWDQVCADLIAVLHGAPTLSAIVAGRFATLLEGPTARATLTTRVIDDRQMALTQQQVRQIAAATDNPPPPQVVDVLVTRPSLRTVMELRYVLDLLSRGDGAQVAKHMAAGATNAVTAALSGQVRHDVAARVQDPDLLDFLGVGALAPYLDNALATTLAGPGRDPAHLLASLETAGVGHWSHQEQGEPVFLLGDHVRGAAAAQFVAQHPAQARTAWRAVAHWLATDRSNPGAAIEYALRGGDLDYADQLAMRAFPLPTEEHVHLAQVLAGIPGAKIRTRPMLSMLYALYLNSQPARRAQATTYFTAAVSASRGKKPTSAANRMVLASLQSSVWRLLGQHARMLDAARRAMRTFQVLEEHGGSAGEMGMDQPIVVCLGQCAMSLLYGGDRDGATDALDALSSVAARRGWDHHANIAASGRAMIACLDGQMAQARTHIRAVKSHAWPQGWVNSYHGAFDVIARAWLHLDAGDPDSALRELDRLARHMDTIEHWEFIASPRAIAQAMKGHTATGAQELRQVRRQHVGPTTLATVRQRLGVTQALVGLSAGQVPAQPGRSLGKSAAAGALGAMIASARADTQDAVTQLARAHHRATTALDQALVAVAGITVAIHGPSPLGVQQQAAHLATLITAHDLHWPVALICERDRVLATGSLGDQPGAMTLATAFERVPAIVGDQLWHSDHIPALTARELQVLRELATTASRTEIAARLGVSPNTVKAHLRGLYGKLGVSSRAQALTQAVALGLLVADPATAASLGGEDRT